MQFARWPAILYAVFISFFSTSLLGDNPSGMTGHSAVVFDYLDGMGGGTGLTVDASGNVWGTTPGGGFGNGTVFELTRNSAGQWTHTVLYAFTPIEGGFPTDDDGPLIDSAGSLYGTTYEGGFINCGTVFKLTPRSRGWKKTVLWTFDGGSDGCWPMASLVSDSAGNLYGTTWSGGIHYAGCGTVFELSPPPNGTGNWKETTLHIFSCGADGTSPASSLILDRSGNIYGTTHAGGSNHCQIDGNIGCGVIFKLTKGLTGAWDEQVLHTFMGGNEGAFPEGKLVFDVSGNIYGVSEFAGDLSCAVYGCGTVFRLAPPIVSGGQWSLSTLHTFTGVSDGGNPTEGLIVDKTGVVYGTAAGGGMGNCFSGNYNMMPGCGTVYRLTPTLNGEWNFELLYSFSGTADGGLPSKITFVGPSAYIPTGNGGELGASDHYCRNGCGTIFELSTTSQ